MFQDEETYVHVATRTESEALGFTTRHPLRLGQCKIFYRIEEHDARVGRRIRYPGGMGA